MASEAKRGCGYRKVGGLYIVDAGSGMPCCKMPIPLTVCPCCSAGIKQTRGWTWLDAAKMFPATPCSAGAIERVACPAANPAVMGKVGLLWIGESFYPRPVDFLNEAANLGISRRLSKVPRAYKAGETWVLFAHPKAIQTPHEVYEDAGAWSVKRPEGASRAKVEHGDTTRETKEEAERLAATLDLEDPAYLPGIIRICRPRGFEKIVKQSDYDRALADKALHDEAARISPTAAHFKSAILTEFEADAKRGVTWVPVPDDDKDHMGSVHDRKEEETV